MWSNVLAHSETKIEHSDKRGKFWPGNHRRRAAKTTFSGSLSNASIAAPWTLKKGAAVLRLVARGCKVKTDGFDEHDAAAGSVKP
jgi:hypothetical protein